MEMVLSDVTTILESLISQPQQILSMITSHLPKFSRKVETLQRVATQIDIAPRTETERRIARVWEEAFQIDSVGLHENFFDLGGHSILMVRVHKKLIESFNREISIVKMFQYPTVSALAGYLSQELQAPSYSDVFDRAKKQKEALARQKKVLRRN
jgi:hypothetical protein